MGDPDPVGDRQDAEARTNRHLAQIHEQHPDALERLDFAIRHQGQDGIPDWPQWCYAPIALAMACVMAKNTSVPTPEEANVAARIAGLAPFQLGRGVYTLDDSAILRAYTDIKRSTARVRRERVLGGLPELCVYVDLGAANPFPGMYIYLEYDAESGPELRGLLDLSRQFSTGDPDIEHLMPVPIHLDDRTISASNKTVRRIALQNAEKFATDLSAVPSGAMAMVQQLQESAAGLIWVAATALTNPGYTITGTGGTRPERARPQQAAGQALWPRADSTAHYLVAAAQAGT